MEKDGKAPGRQNLYKNKGKDTEVRQIRIFNFYKKHFKLIFEAILVASHESSRSNWKRSNFVLDKWK